MSKIERKPLEGFEQVFGELQGLKANLEAKKEAAKNEVLMAVEAKFAERQARIDNALETVSEEVEVAEVVEEVSENLEEVE